MRLEIFGEADSKKWDGLIDNSFNGTLYHTWKWLDITKKYSESKLYPLVFFDAEKDKPFGAIPLFHIKRLGLNMVFSPPPGSAVTLGPVIANKRYKQHKFELAYMNFQSSIDSFLKKLGANYTLIVTSPGLIDVRPFSWAHYDVNPSYTYKIDLKQGEENIWKNLSQSLKTNINNASRRGIKVIESTDERSVERVFYSVKQRYDKQHRKLALKLGYLKDLSNQFGQTNIKTYLAMYEGNVVGSQICVIHKDSTISWVGGSRTESNNLEANELVMWHTISEAIHKGFNWFEIEGANTSHLCDAKSRFCPAVSIYFTIRKIGFIGSMAEKLYMMRKTSKL